MNILLINYEDIPNRRNPIAILDIAAYCRSKGHIVVCKQKADVKPEHYMAADIVGISCIQPPQGRSPVGYAESIVAQYDKKVVIGGKWAKGLPDESPLSDKVTLTVLDGENYFDPDRDTDSLMNHPAWDIQDMRTLGPKIEIMSSRGCPYHCHFCNNTESKVRYFSAERTAMNALLVQKMGASSIFIVDDVFTINAERMGLIRRTFQDMGVTLPVRFFAHVNCLNGDVVEEIQKFKPIRVTLGLESGDAQQLKNMGKTFMPEDAEKKLQELRSAGIKVGGCFLIGFPGETKDSLENTFKFVKRTAECYHKVHVSLYQPVRGTVGFNRAVERMPSFKGGRQNHNVTYIDPNLTAEILVRYKNMIKAAVK